MGKRPINVFYLSGLNIQDADNSVEKLVRYSSGRQTYEGIVSEHYLNNNTLPVTVLTKHVKKGLTLVELIAGNIFNGKRIILVHINDLVTKSQVSQSYGEHQSV